MSTPAFVQRRLDNSTASGLVLAVVCIAQFMVVLDISIVNVAIPDMQKDLGMSQNALGWVLNAYTLTFAGFLLLGGRAADLWGRKRLFLLGVTVFSLTSLVGGLAQTGGQLIGARALQGLGGAILAPATLTILTTTFTEPKARARALGAWSAMAAAGGATGVLAGGILTDLLSWRWILFINVPIGLLVYVVARLVVSESTAEGERPTLDWGGAITVTGGLVALVYGIVSTDSHSWGSTFVISYLVAGVMLLGAFLFIETRHRHPLVPLRLFRSRALVGANLIMIVVGSIMFSMFFFLSQYLQDVRGYSPLKTGLAFLPMPIAIIIGTQISTRLVGRVGVRVLLTIGPAISAVGMLLLARLDDASSYLGVLPAALTTFGIGMSFVPVTIAATSSVGQHEQGLASGVINTTRQIGGSVGLAALLTIATSRTHALADDGPLAALTAGYARAFAVGAGLLVLAAVIAWTVIPQLRPPNREPELVESDAFGAPAMATD